VLYVFFDVQTASGRGVATEKLKRKDYEISELKRQLCEQQRELDEARQKLRQRTRRTDDQQHDTV